jgi:hypothetical protein
MSHVDTQPRSFSADRLNASLDEVGGSARPDYLTDIVAQAGRTRQRPAWTFLERWLPMDIAVRRQGVPRAVLVFALLALLITLLVATVAFVGTRPTRPVLAAATNGQIAFSSGGDIIVVEPDGTGRRTLISGASETGGLEYSPDGRRLAYWSRPGPVPVGSHRGRFGRSQPGDDRSGIADATSDPHGPRTVARSPTRPGRPGPRGRHVQVWNGEFCTSRIYRAATDGSGTRQIGDLGMDARAPDWSPDGSKIAFGGGGASPAVGVHLYLMDADGSNVRQVSDVVGSDWAFVGWTGHTTAPRSSGRRRLRTTSRIGTSG